MSAELFHIESEHSVLGALLLDPMAMDRIDWLAAGDFYHADHRTIFSCVSMLLAERKPVDVITVAERLLSDGVPEIQVDLAYLGELAATVPSAANIQRYAEVVRDKRMLRDLMAASAKIADIATLDGSMPASERIDEATGVIFSLSESIQSADAEATSIADILPGVVEAIQRRFDNGGEIVGLPTGFTELDESTSGLADGDLVIIAGRPSMGKTAVAMNIAENAAINEGKTVLIISMEMTKQSLSERSLSSVGGISMKRLRNGQLIQDKSGADDFNRMGVALGKLSKAKMVIDDRGGLSVAQMRATARRVAARNGGIGLIVVDYIQLASAGAANKGGNREQEVSAISRGLKGIAKEFGCPVIALSQLSRKVEDRADKRPLMSDLRESGAIEQDADLILMMYRDEYYTKEQSKFKGLAEIVIAKQRMGETGSIFVAFQGEFSRFKNLSHEDQAAVYSAQSSLQSDGRQAKKRGGFDD